MLETAKSKDYLTRDELAQIMYNKLRKLKRA